MFVHCYHGKRFNCIYVQTEAEHFNQHVKNQLLLQGLNIIYEWVHSAFSITSAEVPFCSESQSTFLRQSDQSATEEIYVFFRSDMNIWTDSGQWGWDIIDSTYLNRYTNRQQWLYFTAVTLLPMHLCVRSKTHLEMYKSVCSRKTPPLWLTWPTLRAKVNPCYWCKELISQCFSNIWQSLALSRSQTMQQCWVCKQRVPAGDKMERQNHKCGFIHLGKTILHFYRPRSKIQFCI